ncbi:thioesterase domain-containing protein [Micromonospora chokoriensis]|uniref:thioesterase domain-containing protein n=1 Tax=Micromonospora chokoriensis TaxID=356851 RepID=UPI00068DCEFE|nr:thioesterase domain-containing protein [Micromonospora chokoriensis]
MTQSMPATTPGGWFIRVGPGPAREGATRLYVFPHAGGGPGALGALAAALPASVEPWALHLPGRQARIAEPPRTDLEPLLDEIAADLTATAGEYALFGFCGGALLAFLAARRSKPTHLFVGSYAAPDVAGIPRRLHTLPSDRFWDVVLAQGGVAPELAERRDLRPMLEDAIRADFALYAGYRPDRAAPLGVPVSVLYGREDTELTTGALVGWRRQTGTRPALCELNAGHWLIDEDPAGVAACITARLAGEQAPPVRPAARLADPTVPAAPDGGTDLPAAAGDVLAAIRRAMSDAVGRPLGEDENFFDAGLGSSDLVRVHAGSTAGMTEPFPVTAMFAYPNLRALRRHLAAGRTSAGVDQHRRTGETWREMRRRLHGESEQR